MVLSSSPPTQPHVALLPSAGMGHINPFCRLAISLIERGCTISFVAAQPTVSAAEALAITRLVESFPNKIQCINLPLVELDPSRFPPTTNPLSLRFEAIRESAHLLPGLLAATSVPLNALIIDVISASTFIPIAKELTLPCYLLIPSSAAMLSLLAYLPTHIAGTNGKAGDVDIPEFGTIPNSSLPSPLREPNKHLFGIQFLENGRFLEKSDGILIYTFQEFEPEVISALNSGKVVPNLPPVIPMAPVRALPYHSGKTCALQWLDEQPDKSVVYLCFGTTSGMTGEQIEEIGAGIEKSGQRYLWVIKTKKVDREEEEEGNMKRVGERGLVVNGWVEQEEILQHKAVGGFVSHIGWNSVMEAAMEGIRVLGWARGGDQKVNGGALRRSGLGVWMEEWFWEDESGVVKGDEIARRVKEMMEDEEWEKAAARVGEVARAAMGPGGSSAKALDELVARLMG